MKAITKKATITTERGTVVNMTATVTRGVEMVNEELFNDGWNLTVEKAQVTEKTEVVLNINGKDYKGFFTTCMPAHVLKGCFGCFLAGTQPIGFSQVKYNDLTSVVAAAKNEAETDQSWINYCAREAAAEKAEIEYYAHKKRVEDAMSY